MRCEDCLDDLPPTHFVVYELMTASVDADEPDDWDEKHVCADCAGWYGDSAMEIETT